ncbi:MAG: NADH:ubiquinone oxidoreductase [Nitrospirae bacterium]|nr:NADH:ubiquinone oxidoreductase [Nitrospirota bacterium]
MAELPKISIYWASSCGGCEISVVNLNEKILDVAANFNLFFCPCLLDTKKTDIEALPDKDILITFFNGSIKNEDNAEMAHLLRKKSQLLIAFGSCSSEGCIPGLSNLHSLDDQMNAIYLDNLTTINPDRIIPRHETIVPEGALTIPAIYDRVRTLSEIVEVDYYIPGCPPEPHQIWNVIDHVIKQRPLPERGSVIGAGRSTVCDECSRKKGNKSIKKFYRTYEIVPEPETCLLEQGLICMGIATRDGCGGLCPKVNMPCTGCYGTPEGVLDQGAKMAAALGSILDIGDVKGLTDDEINKRIDDIINEIPDFAGMFYKYSLCSSILKGKVI